MGNALTHECVPVYLFVVAHRQQGPISGICDTVVEGCWIILLRVY